MIKIAHVSDTHIRNLKYHKEYRAIFDKMYEILRNEEVDYIVHCGDIAHTKTQISPEFVEMCANFFKSLAEIAPTYVIPGNHDGNLRNSTRQDALTPIVNALSLPDLHLLKSSGEVPVTNDLTFNVLSVFDEENWTSPTDLSKINIALYHGSVAGVVTDTGYVMEHGDHDISIFKDFDYAMLGDIHKTNQALDPDGRCRYPGSTVQQNHGETNDKGFLIWEIHDKDTFDVRHIAIENPKPFITIDLTPKGKVPKNTVVPKGARIRLSANSFLPLTSLKRAMDVVKRRFKPESVTYINRVIGGKSDLQNLDDLQNEDLRDLHIQEKLIKEFLEDYQVENGVMDTVIELNKKYNTMVESEDDIHRNVKWNLKKLNWNNLFNYNEGNSVDFEALSGVVGIFGKNFSGKSSIVDSFLWTLQNSTSKNVRKNLNIVNQNKNGGSGRVEIQVGDIMYVISRRADKYMKRLAGEEIQEAKTDVDFTSFDITEYPSFDDLPEEMIGNENGMSRPETDKNIRKVFGTLDDFLLTSMTSQVGSLSFIDEGSTERKKIFGKFMDLDVFAKKYKLANDDAADIKGALRRLENRDFDQEILEADGECKENERLTSEHKDRCDAIKQRIKEEKKKISDLDVQIAALPAGIDFDINEARSELDDCIINSQKIKNDIKKLDSEIADDVRLIKNTREMLEKLNVEELEEKKELILQNELELNKILSDISTKEWVKNNQESKIKLLREVPCGDQFPTCKFLVDAHAAKEKKQENDELITVLRKKQKNVRDSIDSMQPEKVDDALEKYKQLFEKKRDLEVEISQDRLKIERLKAQLSTIDGKISSWNDKISEYEKNEEAAALLKSLKKEKSFFEKNLRSLDEELDECEAKLFELYKSHGSLEQKKKSLEEAKEELRTLREQYSAYELFEKCMHSNGITYDIIKRRLPVINEEIAKVLSNVVNFEAFFEDDGKKLDIYIRHPKYEPRLIELGSGAEKMLVAMAIRLALIKISSLPVGDIFILDEPATALDEENMEGFIRIVDMLKTQFKTILIISHLDALKDIVDQQIVIEKVDGYAHVEI